MDWDSLPDVYWHCRVAFGGKQDREEAITNDLTKEQLRREIVEPWHRGDPFTVGGRLVRDRAVDEICIVQTTDDQGTFARNHNLQMRARKVGDLVTNRRRLPFRAGKEYTYPMLFEGLRSAAPAPDVALLLRLCERLPDAARELQNRRKGKQPFTIVDEYDAQDLLHAMIRSYFKYSVAEEPLGRVGGGPSGRADLAIEELGVIIEVKFVRSPNDQNKMVQELSQDLVLYSKWEPLKTFIYLVVNGRDLRDPDALTKLAGTSAVAGKEYTTHIILA